MKLRVKGNSNRREVIVTDAQGQQLYHNSFITDWQVGSKNVVGLVSSARSRWKIENESNNVLKTKGYHLEHNFGHGKKHLASLLMTMNLLAFGLHTLLDITDQNCQLLRKKIGARSRVPDLGRAALCFKWLHHGYPLLA